MALRDFRGFFLTEQRLGMLAVFCFVVSIQLISSVSGWDYRVLVCEQGDEEDIVLGLARGFRT